MKVHEKILATALSGLLLAFLAQSTLANPQDPASADTSSVSADTAPMQQPVTENSTAAADTTSAQQTPEELRQLVAPIALYPDALVAQVLAGSTHPTEIVEADRFMQAQTDTDATKRASEVNGMTWDPSVKALTQFPSVLENMDKNLSWTSSLGEAYTTQPQDVMAAVQYMRQQAQKSGNLSTNSQQTVSTQGQTIIIQPASTDVVYVPAYNPWAVYGYPVVAYPGWVTVPGIFYAGPTVYWGYGWGVHYYGGFGWGWNHWGYNWGGGNIIYNNNVYINNSHTFINNNNWHSNTWHNTTWNNNNSWHNNTWNNGNNNWHGGGITPNNGSNTWHGGGISPSNPSHPTGFTPSNNHGFSPGGNSGWNHSSGGWGGGRTSGWGGGMRSGAFSGFNRGGNAGGFGARGASSFGGGRMGGFRR